MYLSLPSPLMYELSTERSGEGKRERVGTASEVEAALLAARNERSEPLSALDAGESLLEAYGFVVGLGSEKVSTSSKSLSSTRVLVAEAMEERRVEDALLTDFAADRAPLVTGFGVVVFAKARDEAIRAALGTLCGVDERDVLISGLEEAVVIRFRLIRF